METIENKTTIEHIARSIYRRVTFEKGVLTFNQVFLALIWSDAPSSLTAEETIEFVELSRILSDFVTLMFNLDPNSFQLYECILSGLRGYSIGEL